MEAISQYNAANKQEKEPHQHLISEENFYKLKQLQTCVFDATGVSPSMRKLINILINDESITILQHKLIEQFK